MFKNTLIISAATALLLVGCSSDSTESSQTDLATGYFIDAPVEGLSYSTSSGLSGVTDAQGRFHYKRGEKVRFSLGKLDFGEAQPTAEGLVSPEQLTQKEEAQTLMLRTLQALDIDNDPSNGITIPNSAITALSAMTADVSLATLSQEEEILNLDTHVRELLDEDYDGQIDVDKTQAEAHFHESITQWNGGTRPENNSSNHTSPGAGAAFDLETLPLSTLSQEVKDSLAYMGNEERLAYDIYTTLYTYHDDAGTSIKQLLNIPKSEQRHVQIVRDLIKRYQIDVNTLQDVVNPVANQETSFEALPSGQYDVAAVQELYDTLYAKGIASPQAALEVGCMVEVVDVDDLDKYIQQATLAQADDVVAAFKVLRDGSYNHYWAFDKGLKNMGVLKGCAVLGEDYAKTAAEYPTSHK